MLTRRLGRTNLEVTQLGYGSMGLRGPRTWGMRVVSEDEAEQVLHAVLDAGINFIDTSPDYGICEERIGRCLAGRRREFILATKCGCVPRQHDDHLEIHHVWKRDVIQRNLETSLTRLRTHQIDLLQFHGGDAKTLEREGLIDLLVRFREQGLIRFLGVSTKLPDIHGLLNLGVFDTVQLPYSCLAAEHDGVITAAAEAGVGIILRGGVAHGGPDAKVQRQTVNDAWSRARLAELLPSGMTPAELILRFTLSHPHCHTTIVGTCNADHLAENIAAATRGPLPESLVREILSRIAQMSS